MFIVAMSLFGLWTCFSSIGKVPNYYFDEPYYVNASQSFVDWDAVKNWEHPPLGKYGIALGRAIFSDRVFGSRFFSFLFSMGTLVLLFFSANRFRDKSKESQNLKIVVGWIAVFLASTDPFFLNMSKVAMLDAYALFFEMGSIYFAFKALDRPSRANLNLTALMIGLGLATKWSLLPFAVVVSYCFFRLSIRSPELRGRLVSFLLIILCSYFVPFIPYCFVKSTGASAWAIVKLQAAIFQYHDGFHALNQHASSWWTWPLQIKPLWLELRITGEGVRGLLTVGNLPTYYLFLLILVLKLRSIRSWSLREQLLILGYLSHLLFWCVFSSRTTYSHYYLMCVPFIYLIIADWFGSFQEWKYFKICVLVSVALFFLVYRPLVSFDFMSMEGYQGRMILASWPYLFR